MSKIIPLTIKFTSEDMASGAKQLGLSSHDVFTGVLSISCRVSILSNPSIPPIDVDVDVDSQDDRGLITTHTFEDSDGNEHTLHVAMTPESLSVVVTDAQQELEQKVEIETKLRVEVEPVPKKEEEKIPTVKEDIRKYASKPTSSTKRMVGREDRRIMHMGQEDLIFIIGMKEDLNEHNLDDLSPDWTEENLGDMSKEDYDSITQGEEPSLSVARALACQSRLNDIIRGTYGIPTLVGHWNNTKYYFPMITGDGDIIDAKLITSLDFTFWKDFFQMLPKELEHVRDTDEGDQLVNFVDALSIQMEWIYETRK